MHIQSLGRDTATSTEIVIVPSLRVLRPPGLAMMLLSVAAAVAYTLAPTPLAPHAPAVASARAARIAMEEGVASLAPTAAQKTWFPKAADMAVANKKWYVVDAEGMRLGRMASEVAKILLGKDKATFTPGCDVGDAVVIVNAEKVIVTGNKAKDKLYRRHSGRPGGMKLESYEELQVRMPERIVEKAIVGMLPKNSHGRNLFRHLKVRLCVWRHQLAVDCGTPVRACRPALSHRRPCCRPSDQPRHPENDVRHASTHAGRRHTRGHDTRPMPQTHPMPRDQCRVTDAGHSRGGCQHQRHASSSRQPAPWT